MFSMISSTAIMDYQLFLQLFFTILHWARAYYASFNLQQVVFYFFKAFRFQFSYLFFWLNHNKILHYDGLWKISIVRWKTKKIKLFILTLLIKINKFTKNSWILNRSISIIKLPAVVDFEPKPGSVTNPLKDLLNLFDDPTFKACSYEAVIITYFLK